MGTGPSNTELQWHRAQKQHAGSTCPQAFRKKPPDGKAEGWKKWGHLENREGKHSAPCLLSVRASRNLTTAAKQLQTCVPVSVGGMAGGIGLDLSDPFSWLVGRPPRDRMEERKARSRIHAHSEGPSTGLCLSHGRTRPVGAVCLMDKHKATSWPMS